MNRVEAIAQSKIKMSMDLNKAVASYFAIKHKSNNGSFIIDVWDNLTKSEALDNATVNAAIFNKEYATIEAIDNITITMEATYKDNQSKFMSDYLNKLRFVTYNKDTIYKIKNRINKNVIAYGKLVDMIIRTL